MRGAPALRAGRISISAWTLRKIRGGTTLSAARIASGPEWKSGKGIRSGPGGRPVAEQLRSRYKVPVLIRECPLCRQPRTRADVEIIAALRAGSRVGAVFSGRVVCGRLPRCSRAPHDHAAAATRRGPHFPKHRAPAIRRIAKKRGFELFNYRDADRLHACQAAVARLQSLRRRRSRNLNRRYSTALPGGRFVWRLLGLDES